MYLFKMYSSFPIDQFYLPTLCCFCFTQEQEIPKIKKDGGKNQDLGVCDVCMPAHLSILNFRYIYQVSGLTRMIIKIILLCFLRISQLYNSIFLYDDKASVPLAVIQILGSITVTD